MTAQRKTVSDLSTCLTEPCWLVKQEPSAYSFSQFLEEKTTAWTGVRNPQARKNLRAMRKGDFVFYYHTGNEKAIVGAAKVKKEAYPDPTDTSWDCVDLEAIGFLPRPLPLAEIKSDPRLQDLPLVRQARLSVMPIPKDQAEYILRRCRGNS